MHTNGNHEIELQPDGSRFRSYNNRYPVPQTHTRRNHGPTVFPDVTATNAWENLYWSVEVPGAFKAIYLTSYSPDQPMEDWEEQYIWLEKELDQVDRHRTPWVLVNWHAPWYNTYAAHYKETEAMREAYESLLVEHQVDIVFNGHVHAYERKTPIVDNEVNHCGPVSITIGDGGNTEGLYRDFIDTRVPPPAYCQNAKANGSKISPSYQPRQKFLYETDPARCLAGETGCFCYGSQPDWSAYREPSYSYGILEFKSPTRAVWTWHSNQKARTYVADQVTIIRNSLQCPMEREY